MVFPKHVVRHNFVALNELIKKVTIMRNKEFIRKALFLVLSLFILVKAGAQITGQGQVINGEDNTPFPFVTVYEKGKTNGVVTDGNGQFSISLPTAEAILVASSLGYKSQELPAAAGKVLRFVLLPDLINIDEVVVTAVGISREKKALSYAVQDVKGEELTKSRQTNAIGLLSGKVAGLQIISAGGALGGSSRVLVRGVSSVLGNNQPLYVIDGTPIDNTQLGSTTTAIGYGEKDYGNTAADINPDDIESMSVLKGASATALYGSRANNGVILITTKKGTNKNKTEISLSTGISLENQLRSSFAPMQKLYGGGASNQQTFNQVVINGQSYNVPAYAIDESWGPKFSGQQVLSWENLYPEDEARYLKTTEWKYPEHDLMYYFKTGVAFDNNISVRGGNEIANYRVSYTNRTATGTTPNSKLSRNNLSASGSLKHKNFIFSSSVNYMNTGVVGRPWTGTSNRNVITQAYSWGQNQVDYKELSNYKRPDGSQRLWNVTSWDNLKAKYIDNPYWASYTSYSDENRDRVYGNAGVEWNIAKGLKATAKVHGDVYTYSVEDRIAVYSRTTSMYSEKVQRFQEFNYEAMLHYNTALKNFTLNAFIGTNLMHQRRNINNGETQGGLIIPEYYNLSNATSVLTTDKTYRKEIRSLLGNVSLGWKSMLFADATFRNDWSSTLPANENSYFYPSFSGSFIFTELEPVKAVSWLNFGKVRLGWAQVGNDTDPYSLSRTYEYKNSSFGGVPNYGLDIILNNAHLKPELTNSVEAGIELKLLNNRVGLDLTYYNNLTKNQIMQVPLAASSGYTSQWMNAGEISNKGLEVVLNVVPVQTANFQWEANFNWSKNNNKVEKLNDQLKTLQIASSFVALHATVGKPYGELMGYNYVFDSEGNKVVAANGVYAKTAQTEGLGSVLPDWLGGVRNSFRYKNFDAGFLIDVRKGGYFYSITQQYGMYSGTLEETAANGIRENGLVLEGVQGTVAYNADGSYTVTNTRPNDKNVSAFEWGRSHSSGVQAQNVFKSDYVKLREITAGYTVPRLGDTAVKDVRFSVFANNVWTIWKANKNFDPDFTQSSGNIQGLDGGNIPSPITYGFNISAKF